MKTLERRQALIELLCERRCEKIDNLAFELGVSGRTISRDIQALSLGAHLQAHAVVPFKIFCRIIAIIIYKNNRH